MKNVTEDAQRVGWSTEFFDTSQMPNLGVYSPRAVSTFLSSKYLATPDRGSVLEFLGRAREAGIPAAVLSSLDTTSPDFEPIGLDRIISSNVSREQLRIQVTGWLEKVLAAQNS